MTALELTNVILAGLVGGGFVELLRVRYDIRPLSKRFFKISLAAALALVLLVMAVGWSFPEMKNRQIAGLILNAALFLFILWVMPRSKKQKII